MSETSRSAHAETKVKEEKVKKDKTQDSAETEDPYCCTPGGGGTGPDTKP